MELIYPQQRFITGISEFKPRYSCCGPFNGLGERLEMAIVQVVIPLVDEISIEVREGFILIYQKGFDVNEPDCVAFPILYANQIINAIKAAAK